MMEKKIIITVVQNGLQIIPAHLKKPDGIEVNIDGLTSLEAIKVISNCLSNMITKFDEQMNQIIQEQKSKGVN